VDYDRLRELQEKFEENPRRYFAPLANEYRKGGQPKRAIEICRVQLAQMPGHMSGQIVFGQALYESGEFDEARKVFEIALTLDPENLIALRSLGDMSLQSGNTAEARRWYMRLLDADPKDTAVIALVSEIDASAEGAPIPTPQSVPIDEDAGDQQIPFIADAEGTPIKPELQPEVAAAGQSDAPAQAAPEASHAPAPEPTAPPPSPQSAAPQPPATPPRAPEPEHARAPEPEPSAAPPTEVSPPPGLERHYPEPVRLIEPLAPTPRTLAAIENEIPLGAEGLHSAIQQPDPTAGLHSVMEPKEPTGAEGLRPKARVAHPEGTQGLKGKPPVNPLAAKPATQPEEETPLDNWTPPPGANVHDTAEPTKEERMFSGPGPEPFVNETMAQLYLQQGYRQLALKVYYQLVEARPNDQGLKDRIAEIEAADRAAHPEVVEARREPPPIERPSAPPAAPRSPSIEAPTPGGAPESEETPSFDRTPIDSPPSRPSRERESVESPGYDEPRAEPEGIAARQPSIREFFATLGRRRPPRSGPASTSAARSASSFQAQAPAAAPPPPAAPPLPTAALGASLDAVFAGAQVNPSDARAASRLAGAFSGTPGAQARTPPTPPTPTPRVNPRLPHTQESEEDVAKFRAWLDGLTGE
jgi:tetratricopeptide (TPR) repeat protein